jgi:DNA-directed RNA polymerase specialized sigma24 family protein
MALTYTVDTAATAVDSVNLDVQLSRRTAALLAVVQPRTDSEKIVHELLDQLKAEKLSREARGLNHWSEHAPKFLNAIVRQARREKQRRHQEAETFYRTRYREVLRFARAIVKDDAAAESVASDTYRELLECGTTTVGNFFMALVGNARNYLARQSYRQEKFERLEEAFGSGHSADGDGKDEERLELEPLSHHGEDQDPLDILIAREDKETRRQEVRKAMDIAQGCHKYRWVRVKHWARELDWRSRGRFVTENTFSRD